MKFQSTFLNSMAVVLGMVFSLSAKATILPENDLYLQDDLKRASNISEAEFNAIIDSVVDVYAPIVKAQGGKLKVNRKWTDSTVNASANQMFGTWYLNMYGGLARRDEITQDGFAMVVCHELGHHLGGFPFASAWAANEGQADYFATQACARKIWAAEADKNAEARTQVDPTAKKGCDAIYRDPSEQNLCYRTANAGLSLGTLLAVLGESGAPKFDTPDTSTVDKTNNEHPAAQCRLDTYYQGALCTAKFDETTIPGKKAAGGTGSAAAEKEAAAVSCMKASKYEVGLRPTCWFHESE